MISSTFVICQFLGPGKLRKISYMLNMNPQNKRTKHWILIFGF